MVIRQEVFDRVYREFNVGKPISIPDYYKGYIKIDINDDGDHNNLIFKDLEFLDFRFDMKDYKHIFFDHCAFTNSYFNSSFTATFAECSFRYCQCNSTFNNSKISGAHISHCVFYSVFEYSDFDHNSIFYSSLEIAYNGNNPWTSFSNLHLVNSSIDVRKCFEMSISDIDASYSTIRISDCSRFKEEISLDSSKLRITHESRSFKDTTLLFQINATQSNIIMDEWDHISSESYINNVHSITTNVPKKYINTIIQTDRIGSREDYTYYDVTNNWVECGCWSCGKEESRPHGRSKGGTLEEFEKRVLSVYPDESNKYHKEYMDAIAQFKKAREEYLKANKE